MAELHECNKCQRKREGRFTRPRYNTSPLWYGGSNRVQVPHWYCWTCLPPGDGSDEDESMGDTMAKVGPTAVNITKYRTEGHGIADPLIKQAADLIVNDAETYLAADTLLSRIRAGRKTWGNIWGQIQDRAVKPLRESLEGLYSINRDIDGPMEKAESALKSSMTAYKALEARRLREAEEARIRSAQAIQAQIDEAQRKTETAATPQLRGRMAKKVEELTEKQTEVITDIGPTAVVGAFSTERKVPTPVITEPEEFWQAVGLGDIELDAPMLEAIRLWLGREYRKDKDAVSLWPGITIEQKPQIVGR